MLNFIKLYLKSLIHYNFKRTTQPSSLSQGLRFKMTRHLDPTTLAGTQFSGLENLSSEKCIGDQSLFVRDYKSLRVFSNSFFFNFVVKIVYGSTILLDDNYES